jgi:hypothetical protein
VELTDAEREQKFVSTDLTLYNTHRAIFWLGLWVSFWAIVLAVVVLFIGMWIARFAALTAIALVVAFSVYFVTRRDHQLLACVALFIFLRQVFTPDIEMSIFYWYTEADDGPHFSAIYIGQRLNTLLLSFSRYTCCHARYSGVCRLLCATS